MIFSCNGVVLNFVPSSFTGSGALGKSPGCYSYASVPLGLEALQWRMEERVP